MNCGLGNLATVKRHLLAGTMSGEFRFDALIQDIALGVASVMENFCNRKFERMVGDQAIFQGDRASFVLPRYPVEVITAVETKQTDADPFVAQSLTIIQSTSLASGVVYFPDQSDGGAYWSQVRFTFTGGFWWEELEPEDAVYPTALPAGARRLPGDLQLAWLIQCREVWSKIDKLGTGITAAPDGESKTGILDLSPMVKRTLQNYVQMQPI